MVLRASESIKRAFNYEYANLAVSFFYLLLIAALFIEPAHFRNFDPGLVLITNIVFFNLIHVLFQYWLMETSPQYRAMVAKNIGMTSISAKMIAASVILVFVLYALKSNAALAVWLRIFVVAWASQHSFGQTYGLYCAKRLNGAQPKADFKDIFALKIFVIFAVCTQIFLAVEASFNFISPAVEKPLYLGIMSLVFLWIGAVAVYVMKQTQASQKFGWMFARFLMVGISCVSPIALVALFAVHGAEYFDVTRKVRARSEVKPGRVKFWIPFALVILTIITFEFYVFLFRPAAGSPVALIISSFALSLTMVHYLFDSFAYKMKHPESRKNLIELLH